MLASLVIFMVLGMVGLLVSDTSRILRRSEPQERLLEAIELGSERICSELSCALRVTTPSSGTASFLAFDRIDPSASARLPNPLPDPLPTSWDPQLPAHVLTVAYRIDSGTLLRQVSTASRSVSEEVCHGLTGMSATRVGEQTVKVTLSILVNENLKTVEREAHLWIVP